MSYWSFLRFAFHFLLSRAFFHNFQINCFFTKQWLVGLNTMNYKFDSIATTTINRLASSWCKRNLEHEQRPFLGRQTLLYCIDFTKNFNENILRKWASGFNCVYVTYIVALFRHCFFPKEIEWNFELELTRKYTRMWPHVTTWDRFLSMCHCVPIELIKQFAPISTTKR